MTMHDQPSWRRYLRFWRSDVPRDVNEEIAFHVEALTEIHIAQGMSPEEARAAALRRFGDPDRVAGAMRALAEQGESKMRRTEWWQGFDRDVRHALRQLRRRPAFTAVALTTLALAIGVNTAIFSAVNTVLLRPLPVDLDGVVRIYDNIPNMGLPETPLDPVEAQAIAQWSDVFDAAGASQSGSATLTGQGDTRRLARSRTLGRFFDVFGVTPELGRLYRPDESLNGQHRVLVLSHDFWRELGGDPAMVGRSLVINGESFEVVGVMRAGFRYPRGVQFWSPFPIAAGPQQNNGRLVMNTVGRLRDGVPAAQLESRLETLAREQHPGSTRENFFMSHKPFVVAFAGELRPVLIVLLAAVGFVLLIACANVASLQLVHAAARARELGVRAALGAERWIIMRQLLVENLVLSVAGGALGLLAGVAVLKLLTAAGASDLPALENVRFDVRVLAFTAAATILSGVLVGLAPALRAGRLDLNEGLKEGARNSLGARKNRLLRTSVVVQVALTLVLLSGSALMIRTLGVLLSQNPGFDSAQVHTMRVAVTGPNSQPAQLTIFYDRLLERLRGMSAFEEVGFVSELPFSGSNDSSPFQIRGREADPNGPALHANLHTVGGDYFQAMRIPLLRGRAFEAGDAKQKFPWVAVIDETLAKTYFGDEDPIGRMINQGPDAIIIGVVGTVSQGELGEPAKSTIYYPYSQHDWYSNVFLTVRSSLPLATVQSMVRDVLREMDPVVALYDPRTLDERISVTLAPRRLTMAVLSGLAALSLALAVFGLYGVISYGVSQRKTEFGIRFALGAQPADVRRMVLLQGLGLAAIGVAIGVAGAWLATRALTALIYGVSPRDPLTLIGASVTLIAVTAVAAYLPARRATTVSPVEALRG